MTEKYTVDYRDDQWVALKAEAGMCCRPTTENYWAAHAAVEWAKAKKLEVRDWKRVFEMLRQEDARLGNSANGGDQDGQTRIALPLTSSERKMCAASVSACLSESTGSTHAIKRWVIGQICTSALSTGPVSRVE